MKNSSIFPMQKYNLKRINLRLDLAHSLPFRFFKSAKNEENMIVKNS
jgi:hypothetical protein